MLLVEKYLILWIIIGNLIMDKWYGMIYYGNEDFEV